MFIEKIKSAWPGDMLKRVRMSHLTLSKVQRHLGKIMILIPMLLLTLYLLIFSQPRYLSESKVAIKHSNDLNGALLPKSGNFFRFS